MDAFEVHPQLIADYKSLTAGFAEICDLRGEQLQRQAAEYAQWPPLNPSFAVGGQIDELVWDGLLHLECARIFRAGKSATGEGDTQLTLHKHQVAAIHAARRGICYVLTMVTGSVKLLSCIGPIASVPVIQPDLIDSNQAENTAVRPHQLLSPTGRL